MEFTSWKILPEENAMQGKTVIIYHEKGYPSIFQKQLDFSPDCDESLVF